MALEALKKIFARKPGDPLKPPPFGKMVSAYLKRLEKWPPAIPLKGDGQRIGILVTPWLGTAVPFLNLEIALMLDATGEQITVIWDSVDLVGNACESESEHIGRALAAASRWLKVEDVRESAAPEGARPPLDDAWIEAMLFENGVWRMRGEGNAPSYVGRKMEGIAKIREHISKVDALLARGRWNRLLIPGGVWGLTSIYVALAQRHGCSFATYDCGFQTFTLCHDGVACHQTDVAEALRLVKETATESQQTYIRQRAWRELDERMKGRGNYTAFQVTFSGGQSSNFNVLVPLNQRWDTAALARQRLFPTVEDWIVGLLRWAADDSEVRLCIRQHPTERHKAWRGSDDIAALVQRENRAGERVRFVAAEETVSTYDLLRTTKVVSPYTSSVGVESGMLGVPVVVSALNYYDRTSFVVHPESPEEYFTTLSRGIRGELSVPEQGRDDAALLYHLVQDCNIMPTIFTAVPIEFLEWIKIPSGELWALPPVLDLCESLRTGRPLSYLHSRRVLAEGGVA
jgi:hypothetical protein